MADLPAAKADWEKIERLYRAGKLSVSEIGRDQGVSHTAINKRAKKYGWTPDLSEQIKQAIDIEMHPCEGPFRNLAQAERVLGDRLTFTAAHRRDCRPVR